MLIWMSKVINCGGGGQEEINDSMNLPLAMHCVDQWRWKPVTRKFLPSPPKYHTGNGVHDFMA